MAVRVVFANDVPTLFADVAKAERLAGPGELVVSPSVYELLRRNEGTSLPSKLVFTNVESQFQRVSWPGRPTLDEMLFFFKDQRVEASQSAQFMIADLVQSTIVSNPSNSAEVDPSSIETDLARFLERHRHAAARDTDEKFTAELRRVVVLFIRINYEPDLPEDPSEDREILEMFQSIYSIITECVASRLGQVRQFINDDKGTVYIASFGLRGSVPRHLTDTAIDAAIDAQKKLRDVLNKECSIGITLGKIFCGQTGSFQRYEYSLLGPSVNLSARLMARGSWGQINCDEGIKQYTSRRYDFSISGRYQVKGYNDLVPFFVPNERAAGKNHKEQDDVVTFYMQNPDVVNLVDGIIEICQDKTNTQPRITLIQGNESNGKDAFISAILKQPRLFNSSLILEANKCYHDDPFFCFTPIISRILLSFEEVQERLEELKKRHKRSSALASFLATSGFKTDLYPCGVDIVPAELRPYLSLINDFVFKGFPLLNSSLEVKRMKDGEKVDKCIEVLHGLILQFLELRQEPGILCISDIDSLDRYSGRLLRRIMNSKVNLHVIGGQDDSSEALVDFVRPSNFDNDSQVNIRAVSLPSLDRRATFQLFLWSLRNDLSSDDRGRINHNDVHDMIFQLSGDAHGCTRLAHAFGTQLSSERQSNGSVDVLECLKCFLSTTPSDFEEVLLFRMDKMSPEEQMLLKIASIAGFDSYCFSQNILEAILLALSQHGVSGEVEEAGNLNDEQCDVPMSIGGNVPLSVGASEEVNQFSYMLQDDKFEQTLDSLVSQKFLEEVNIEMSDLSSLDSAMYRFRSAREQSVVNGLMLNDQKRRIHYEVAGYYSKSLTRGGSDSLSQENDSSVSDMTSMTSLPATDWELTHIIALHYDLAEVPIPAMLNYFESSSQLASLGVRDKAHGRLLSAYLMLEKILHDAATQELEVDEHLFRRRQLVGCMVQTIGNGEMKESLKVLTRDHLNLAFSGDIVAFTKGLQMLMKFGQSTGTIEEEGYLFGSELYLQTILLVLLTLEDGAFATLTTGLSSYLGQQEIIQVKRDKGDDDDDEFCLDDLTVSFPAFSGLLTFYRDSPIGANQVQETFLASMFVAVTKEANQGECTRQFVLYILNTSPNTNSILHQSLVIHELRTKCILSHLYLKHGNVAKALEECEGIKEIYDHDLHSLELVTMYGMDWSIVCIGTMASTYLFQGRFAAARHNIEFLEEQLTKLDEFASSTKAMTRGTIASYYLLLREFEKAAEMSKGIAETKYGFFFKPFGVLVEELANRELSLHQQKKFDGPDSNLLDILSTDAVHGVNLKRSMLSQSAETLCDRGIEAMQASVCFVVMRNLELHEQSEEVLMRQIRYCQAGLVYLKQTLGQTDANNHERRKNFLACLFLRATLLRWHHRLQEQLQHSYNEHVDDILGIEGCEVETAKQSLDECYELSVIYSYPFMQLLVGKSLVDFGYVDPSEGDKLMQKAFCSIDPADVAVFSWDKICQ